MASITPPRTSRRLDLKRQAEGPEAVSAVKKFKLTPHRSQSPDSPDNYVTTHARKKKPSRTNSASKQCSRIQTESVLKVKLQRLHFDASKKNTKNATRFNKTHQSKNTLTSKNPLPSQTATKTETDTPTSERMVSALVETLSQAPAESKQSDELFSAVGAVVPLGFDEEMSYCTPDWHAQVAEKCGVTWQSSSQIHVVMGSPQQLIAAKCFMQELLEEAREVKRAAAEETETDTMHQAMEDEEAVNVTVTPPRSPSPVPFDNIPLLNKKCNRFGPRKKKRGRLPNKQRRYQKKDEPENSIPSPESPKALRSKKTSKNVTKATKPQHQCDLCLMVFVSESALQNHARYHRKQPIPDKAPILKEELDLSQAMDNFYDVLGPEENNADMMERNVWRSSVVDKMGVHVGLQSTDDTQCAESSSQTNVKHSEISEEVVNNISSQLLAIDDSIGSREEQNNSDETMSTSNSVQLRLHSESIQLPIGTEAMQVTVAACNGNMVLNTDTSRIEMISDPSQISMNSDPGPIAMNSDPEPIAKNSDPDELTTNENGEGNTSNPDPLQLVITCELCQMCFLSKGKYQTHFRTHFDPEGSLIEAATEDKSEASDIIISAESKTVHANTEGVPAGESLDLMLEAMMKSSPSEEQGETHEQKEDNANGETDEAVVADYCAEDLVKCDVCGYECTAQLLACHKARVHASKNYCCPLCKRKIQQISDFEFHYTQHFDREGRVRDEFLQVELDPEERCKLERLWVENPQVLPEEVVTKAERLLKDIKKEHKLFKCKFCTFTCKSEKAIKSHIYRHIKHKQKEIECDVCGANFPSKQSLKKHVLSDHNEADVDISHSAEIKEYIAEIDPYDPDSWESLRLPESLPPDEDQELTNVEQSYDKSGGEEEEEEGLEGLVEKCELCDFSGSSASLARHKISKHTKKSLECSYCPKKFAGKVDMNSHIKNYHLDAAGKLRSDRVIPKGKIRVNPKHKFMCRVCGQCGTEQGITVHVENLHRPGGYPCDKCNSILPSKAKLNQHKKSHMSKREMELVIKKRRRFKDPRLWMCHLCSYTTRHSETDLKEHISRKHEAPKYKCEYCGKMFGVLYDMRDHINHMHLKTKQVMCDICGQTMHFKNLKLHKQRIHDNYRPFKCDVCGVGFSEKRLVERHKSRHQPKESRATTVFCKICNKAYVSEKTLRDHMNKHNGIKPYQCDKCDATFGIRAIWLRHRKNHERGQLQCPYSGCSYQAVKESVMNKHLLKRHKDSSQQPLIWSSPLPPSKSSEAVDEYSDQSMAQTTTKRFFVKQEAGDEQMPPMLQVQLEEHSQDQPPFVTMEKEAGLEEDENSTRIYMCSVCQEVFSTLDDTQQHMVLIHGVQVDTVATEDVSMLEHSNVAVTSAGEEAGDGAHIQIDTAMGSAPTVLIDEDGQTIYALTSSGNLEPLEGIQLETADGLTELATLLPNSVVQTDNIVS